MAGPNRIRKYKLALSYEHPLDPKEGRQMKQKIFFEIIDSANYTKNVISKDQNINMFQKNIVEESLSLSRQANSSSQEKQWQWQDLRMTCYMMSSRNYQLEHDTRETFIQLIVDINYNQTWDGFDATIDHLVEDIGRDPHIKESMIAGIM